MMRILQILPELNVGGVETGTVDLAKYLVENGHQSFVISNGGRLVEDLEKSGSRHFCLPVHKKSLSSLKLIKRVRAIIVENKIDIVHARSRVPAWIAYFACRGTDASFITTCHGFYKSRIFSRVMGWAKFIIVPSEVIGRHMIEDFHVPPESIRRIPRSVDTSRFALSKKEKKGDPVKTIAIIGRITPLKGHTFFLQAMAKVVRQHPYARIWVIGDAPANKKNYLQEVHALVKRLGLTKNVEFMGNRKDVAQLLTEVDVLVLSTVTQEAFGRVILEAQAIGVPVVATNVGGVVDIIDQERTGLLVMPKDPLSMARAVLRLLEDKMLAQRLVAAAKEKILQEFTLDIMASRTVAVYEELLRSMRILVIKLSSIGDVVLAVPSLKAIRQKFPKAHLCVLVGRQARKVLRRCPYIDEMIIYDYDQNDSGILGLLKTAHKLRKFRFDKVIDFQNSRKSHWLTFCCLPRESYGYDRKWGFLLTHRMANVEKHIPPVDHQFQLLASVGIDKPADVKLELWPSAKEEQRIEEIFNAAWLSKANNVVGINIAASDKWPTKNWPVEYMAKLCDLLASQHIRVVVTGLEKDKQKFRELSALTKAKPVDCIGRTDILELAVLIKRCKVFITPDSAPLHVAAAVGVPTIAFFGPTSSARHVPPAEKLVVLDRKLACAPCYSSRCHILTHACMKDISPEEVCKTTIGLMGVNV
jgi:lipopolysaccharide heptosyltransferase II